MPRGIKRNAEDYDAEIQQIESKIQLLNAKREEMIQRKEKAELETLTAYLTNARMSAAEAVSILEQNRSAISQAS